MKLFRFWNFDDLNKEDQIELKKKFSSTTVNRKRKNEKISSSTNDDAPKTKQSKIEEKNNLTNEQDETRLEKVWNFYF